MTAGTRATVVVVRRAVLLAQRRLLVADDEGGHGGGEERQPDDERQAAEGHALAGDDEPDADVHRVAQVAVEPADDELLGGRGRRGRAAPLTHEPDEAGHDHAPARPAATTAPTTSSASRPAGEPSQPVTSHGHQPGHDPGGGEEEEERAEGRMSHGDNRTLGTWNGAPRRPGNGGCRSPQGSVGGAG